MAAEPTAPVEVVFAGDDLLSIAVGTASVAQALAAELRASGVWLAAVAGIDSVVVQFDPIAQTPQSAAQRLQAQAETFRMPEETETRLVTIPVVYDG
ncbi:MAG: carboxyltransferase domain-containing protein, partial [Planctomycetota bacterium]